MPIQLSLGYLVEVALHSGGESVVQDVGQIGHEIVAHHHSYLGREQLSLLCTYGFLFLAPW